jgi:hypothetical protein
MIKLLQVHLRRRQSYLWLADLQDAVCQQAA